MGLINILSSIEITTFAEGFKEAILSYKWIYEFISWLVRISGDIGLGIILFTLALKLVTLPLDIISRASMKKNSLKMEMMKDDLEKLQKQYANNKELYQQKMMALYKKNGYSAFSACLPTIITLVFFIIVLNGFQAFSRYTNKHVFNEMGIAYSQRVDDFTADKTLIKDETSENKYLLNVNLALQKSGYEDLFIGYSEAENTDTTAYRIDKEKILSSDFITKYSLSEFFDGDDYNFKNSTLTENVNAEVHSYLIGLISQEEKTQLTESGAITGNIITNIVSFYTLAGERASDYIKVVESEGVVTAAEIDFKKVIDADAEIEEKFYSSALKTVSNAAITAFGKDFAETEILSEARKASADAYYEYRSHSFVAPWVKNLWGVDSPFAKALPDYKEFQSQMQNKTENIGTLGEEEYKKITASLSDEMQTGFGKGNGLFILVAISILAMFASTIISQKTQKAQMQFSSVDGSNGTSASTQKMMTWIMPIMFGVFAFIYSAAFSLYMITSTLLSTLSTIIINYFVERSFKKKIEKELAEKAEKQRYGKRR